MWRGLSRFAGRSSLITTHDLFPWQEYTAGQELYHLRWFVTDYDYKPKPEKVPKHLPMVARMGYLDALHSDIKRGVYDGVSFSRGR